MVEARAEKADRLRAAEKANPVVILIEYPIFLIKVFIIFPKKCYL
jgi:hypothetical protein